MPLNKDENQLFEHLSYEKQAPIDEKYRAELQRIDGLADINKHPQYLKAIKEYAREILDARVSSYIETYKQIGKYPIEEEFETFGRELKEIALRFKGIFARRYNRALSYQYPQQWIDADLDQLSMELEQANGFAVIPLRRFISEGKVKENLDKESYKGKQLYDKVKNLIQNTSPLDQSTARLIIELADGAIQEFGNTNQEEKVELKRIKEQAEEVLPPKTIEDLRKRAEGKALEKAYPKNKKTRTIVYSVIVIIILALGLFALKRAFSGQSDVTKVTTPLTVPPKTSATTTPEPLVSPTPNQMPTPKPQSSNVSGTYKGEIVGELWLQDNLVGDSRTLEFSIDFGKSWFCEGGLEGNAKWVGQNVAEHESPDSENSCRLTFFFSDRKVRVRESQCDHYRAPQCKFDGVYIREEEF